MRTRTHHVISDRTGAAMGFPPPRPGAQVRDHTGRVWTWRDDATNLGELGAWVAPVVGVGSQVGGKVAGAVIGGSLGGPIGAGIALIGSLIAGIFGAHAAKVEREDEISGAWAQSGPAAIDAVMQAYKSGQVSASDAIAGLQSIEGQFISMTTPIAKYQGKFGSFPDPNAPRPPRDCNWACGTAWDLHQQLQAKIAEIQGSSGGGILGGLNLGNLLGGADPVVIGGLLLIGFLLLKK